MQTKIIQWDFDAWEDYLYWQTQDKKMLKKINQLVKDISRNPFEGIGKPEPLKGNLTGFWSRRIQEDAGSPECKYTEPVEVETEAESFPVP